MNICYLCKETQNNQIPVLKCFCYCCSDCYNSLKSQKINNCLVCKKPLKRSGRRNKIENEIFKLNMLYSV